MLRRFVFFFTFGFAAGLVTGAPAGGAKSKKEPAAEDKKKEAATDSHKVRRGDTLWGIARLYGVSVGDIMDLNRLSDSTLREGQTLKIPRPGSDPALAPAKATTYTVAKGETFRGVARKFGLTQDDLERANPKIDPDRPKAGSKLTIPATVSTAEKTEPDSGNAGAIPGISHTVTENDTYHSIAKKYGSTEAAIAAANPGVNPDRLRPGSKLNIPPRQQGLRKSAMVSAPATGKKPISAGGKAGDDAAANDIAGNAKSATDESPKPKTRHYVVSADETPQTISEAFNISVTELYEMNGLKPGSPMRPGLEIQVPGLPGGRTE